METKKYNLPLYFGKCLGKSFEISSTPVQSSQGLYEIGVTEEQILTYAKENLPQEGILKVSSTGLVYVDLPDRYIHDLSSLVGKIGVQTPPYFTGQDFLGAHITSILKDEICGLPLEELHQTIPFTLTGCYKVEPLNWDEMRHIWCLTLDAPLLENLRTKLSLSPRIQDQPFHITFAVEKRFFSLSDILEQRNEEIVIRHIL